MDTQDSAKQKAELFLLACARGLLPDVEGLLADGVAPGTLERSRRGGAHFAASTGELAILQLLHSKGVDLDSEDVTGRSPLHYAAAADNEQVVAFLAGKGCWLDANDENDCSALHLAAQFGAAHAAARLIFCGAKHRLVNRWGLTALGEAICGGHTNAWLAMRTADACSAADLAHRANAYTLLHLAAALGQPLGVAWLIKQNVLDVNDIANPLELSPLHCAVLGGNAAVVESLLQAGAKVTTVDTSGKTPVELLPQVRAPPGDGSEHVKHMKRIVEALESAGGEAVRLRSAALQAAALREIQPADALRYREHLPMHMREEQGRTTEQDMSPAARLQEARTPEQVAAVLKSMSPDHQQLRVKMWAQLDELALRGMQCLREEAKDAVRQVHNIQQLIARKKAVNSLRQDSRFLEDMKDGHVRALVDSVIDNPQNAVKLRNPDAMACLNKMRMLRDVNKANGGGAIDLDELLEPWSAEDDEHVAKLNEAVDIVMKTAVDAACLRLPPKESKGRGGREAPLMGNGEGEAAEGAGSDATQSHRWTNALQSVWIQLVFLALVLAIMWYRGALPSQTVVAAPMHIDPRM